MSFILYLLHTCACVALYQGAREADLPVWTAYGWAEGAGGADATGAAYLWGPSLSTPSALPVICSLWAGRDSDSATGTGTIILCSVPGLSARNGPKAYLTSAPVRVQKSKLWNVFLCIDSTIIPSFQKGKCNCEVYLDLGAVQLFARCHLTSHSHSWLCDDRTPNQVFSIPSRYLSLCWLIQKEQQRWTCTRPENKVMRRSQPWMMKTFWILFTSNLWITNTDVLNKTLTHWWISECRSLSCHVGLGPHILHIWRKTL